MEIESTNLFFCCYVTLLRSRSMKRHRRNLAVFWLLPVIGLASLSGCKEEAKLSDDSKKSPQNTNTDPSNKAGDSNVEAAIATNSGGQHFYAGFDGTTDYSILMPGFREYSISDPSVASIQKVSVELSEKTIAELISTAKAANSQFNEEAEARFREMLGREQMAYKVTPLKPGQATLTSTRGGRGGRDAWGGGDAGIALVINNYTTSQYEAGKNRYTTEGSGLLKSCKSCHETGEEDAPPHELGNIKEISDAQSLQWITTGKVNNRVAKITHTWEFNNDEEKQGIVAYLRAKASKDVETFTKLVFEERFQNFEFPPKGGPGAPPPGP
jgi:hypothetical protein